MRYWDASALVPLLVAEGASPQRARQLREDPDVLTCWATPIECASAINRRFRSGDLRVDGLRIALDRRKELADGWLEVLPTMRVRAQALRLLRVHDLRAADALQLSACLAACDGRPEQMQFICADARLREAAEKEGLVVLN